MPACKQACRVHTLPARARGKVTTLRRAAGKQASSMADACKKVQALWKHLDVDNSGFGLRA